MLTKRETSMSILLVSLLLMELSYCHVLGLGQLDDNYMEMRLRRVLEKLVTLALPKGRMTRTAKDFEVDELLGKTKRALFSGGPQWDTRRNDPQASPNPGDMFGPDTGPYSVSAGVIAGPKGIWAQVGGGLGAVMGVGQNGTWFNQMGHGMGIPIQHHNNVISWTITWPPNPANAPFWSTGSPKFQETTPFPWFTSQSPAWPNWGTSSFGIPTIAPPWSTAKPFWLQDSTVSSNWFFTPTTNPPWFIVPKGANSDPLTKSPNKARTDWDSFTKKIPPWRENSTTTLKPVANSTKATKL